MADPPSLTIVHVLRAPMGGVLRHVRDLATAQSAAGHRVGLICDVAGTDGYNEMMLQDMAGALALGLHRVPMARSTIRSLTRASPPSSPLSTVRSPPSS